MKNVGFGAPQGGIGVGPLSGNRLKGERRDEFCGRLGENGVDNSAALGQFAGQIGTFVGRNAAGNTEKNVFSSERVHI